MHKIITLLIATLGLVGFAAGAMAECGGHLDMATTSSSTVVASDGGTTTKPIVPDGNGG
jgi:hypothetical protein